MAQPFTLYKLIILFMLEESDVPISGSHITQFILDREYTNYFHLQQAIAELAEASFIEKSHHRNMTYYRITEEGRTTLSYFRKEIPASIREEVQKFLAENGSEIRRKTLTQADYYSREGGLFYARLQVKEKDHTLMDLTVSLPSKEAAETMCNNWENRCQDVYSLLMETLL